MLADHAADLGSGRRLAWEERGSHGPVDGGPEPVGYAKRGAPA
jgi:hypothetical protein